ncbi:MAG: translocation/assembly module TamB domain-containing protein [Lautropia sp.]
MPRRSLRRIGAAAASLLALLAVAIGAALWWADSDHGLRFALAQARAVVEQGGGRLDVDGARGGLLGSTRIDRLAWTSAQGTRVVATDVALDWAPRRLLARTVAVSRISAGEVRVALAPAADTADEAPSERRPMPPSLALPLEVVIDDVALATLTIVPAPTARADTPPATAPEPIVLRDLHARARLDADLLRLDELRVRSTYGDLDDGRISVDPAAPHAIDAALPVAVRLDARRWRATIGARGDLARLEATVDAQQQADLDAAGPPDDPAAVSLHAVLAPLAPMPLESARGRVDALDLNTLDSALPTTRLTARVDATANASDPAAGVSLVGSLQASNARAGSVAERRLPVGRVDTRFDVLVATGSADTRVSLDGLAVRLAADGSVDGEITVWPGRTLTLAGATIPQLEARLRLRAIDTSVFAAALPPTALDGSLTLARDAFTLALTQDAATTRRLMPGRFADNAAPLSVEASGRIDGDTLRLSAARASLGDGTVRVAGSASLAAPWTVTLEGSATRIDPAKWVSPALAADPRLADARIEGRWSIDGVVAPEVDARVTLALADSRLGGEPLATDLAARIVGTRRVDAVRGEVSLGANRIALDGALGAPQDRLRIDARIPAPQAIDPRLAGSLDAQATLQGPFDRLRARVDARGRGLALRDAGGASSARTVRIEADLPLSLDVAADTPVSVALRAGGVSIAGQALPAASLRVQGTLGAHRFDASVTRAAGGGKPQALTLAGSGSGAAGDTPSWRATLREASLSGAVPVSLRAPAAVRVDAAALQLDDLALALAGGEIDVSSLRYPLDGSGRIASSGAIRGLPIARLASLAGGGGDGVAPANEAALDAFRALRLGAEWSLRGSDPSSLDGSASVSLGEAAPAGDAAPIGLAADEALRLKIDDGRLDGTVDLALPSLAFVEAFIGPGIAVDGRLRLSGSVAGTLKAPALDLRLRGEALEVLQRAVGWRLRNGTLDLRLDGREATLETLAFDSGEGRVALSGEARLRDPSRPAAAAQAPSRAGAATRASVVPIDARIELHARRMLVPIGPGQRLVVSGDALLGSGADGLSLGGAFAVDKGLIELGGSNAPRLPDDVTLVGADGVARGADGKRVVADGERSGGRAAGGDAGGGDAGGGSGGDAGGADEAAPSPGLRIASEVSVSLGDDLRINGLGFLARLTGELRVGGTLPSNPRVVGEVVIRDGSYLAYGQNLQITKGIVRFAGEPDNPALDIQAKRPFLPVEVGVSITGTAKNPTIALTSKPDMPSAEQLSWLVLGVGPDEAPNAAQSLALQQAGRQLLGRGDGKRRPGIAERLGIDVFNFGYASDTGVAPGVSENAAPTGLPGSGSGGGGSGEGAQREVVTVGKRLSDRLFISYEQGIRGLWNLLRIQYMLSSRLALRGQSGSDNAIDLLYSFTFD